MQSSAMNCLAARLKTAIHSAALNRSGPVGARPVFAGDSVPVDNGEATETGSLAALRAPARQEPHGRADTAGQKEAGAQRPRRHHRQLRAQLGADVRRFTDLGAQDVDCRGELVALGLDLAANLFERAAVTGHLLSTLPRSASLPGSPARAPGEFPCGSCRAPAGRARPR